jgi:hypothetical protein
MKGKVIKSYAGIAIGSEVDIPTDRMAYMVEKGYIEPLKPINAKAELSTRKNKAAKLEGLKNK